MEQGIHAELGIYGDRTGAEQPPAERVSLACFRNAGGNFQYVGMETADAATDRRHVEAFVRLPQRVGCGLSRAGHVDLMADWKQHGQLRARARNGCKGIRARERPQQRLLTASTASG